MIGFEYYNPAKIVFGEDSEKKIKGLLKENNATSLLLVYSGDFIKSLGIYQVIKDAVDELNISFYENGSVVPNPSIEFVRELVDQSHLKLFLLQIYQEYLILHNILLKLFHFLLFYHHSQKE